MNINKPENPERVANLQALKNLRKESVKSYKFNIPFFQELKDKGIINEEWVVSAKGSKKEFFGQLGEPSTFNQILMNRFETGLEMHLDKLPETAKEQILKDTASRVTQSKLNQIDHEAKSTYLTTDAFQKPDSFKFDKALKFYKPENSKFVETPEENNVLARAYMDSALSTHPFKNAPNSVTSGRLITENLAIKIHQIETLLGQHIPEMGKYFEEILKPKGYFSRPNSPTQSLRVGNIPSHIPHTPQPATLSAK
ncbi:hypothetical protein PGTUg99_034182 [Puccinia graminis f. sp. tritici]|uniref:Uncharacterized protein n=1 Tax=Puccinia graminis f. sp. tritici TaxID=56615 RepID=A0A5B0R7R7_PUCGR|nr:hypothetical protein PGTUg99_034182 [Puccinia graminis f. sp. tritici]